MLPLRLPLPRFVSPEEILNGAGSLGALRTLDAARAAVLASPSVLSKHADTLRRSVGAETVELIDMPRGEPTLSGLAPVMRSLERFRPDWIIAVGGGSVIDGAKVAWVCYEHPAVSHERLFLMGGVPTLRGKARFAAAPTTAGSGAEVSSAALLLDPETGAKQTLVSHELLPDLVILDPRLIAGCPPNVIAQAGMDALAHAVESYVSKLENSLADVLAEKAASEILAHLPDYHRDPENADLALRMMNAALLAGWVQNQKVPGIGHAIAHQLGAQAPHGLATGRLLASAVRYNCGDDAVRRKYDGLGHVLGLGNATGLIARIAALPDELGLPTLHDKVCAVSEAIVVGAQQDICARFNPRAITPEAVATVLEGAR